MAPDAFDHADAGAESNTKAEGGREQTKSREACQRRCRGQNAAVSSNSTVVLKTQQKPKIKKCAYCNAEQKRGEEFKANPAVIQRCPSWIRIAVDDLLCQYCDTVIAELHLRRRLTLALASLRRLPSASFSQFLSRRFQRHMTVASQPDRS